VDKKSLSIVIPCLNEEKTIRWVIEDALKYARKYFNRSFEVIVADNGSTDGSQKIIKEFSSNVKLVNVPVRGYGAALHYGIISAKGDYVIFGDADGSYPFSNLAVFKNVMGKKPDLILGSRLKGSIEERAMPWLNRYVGTPILTLLIRLIYSIPTTDCNSGMRMIRRKFYNELNIKNSGMEWASELLLKTALKNGKYCEVPIKFLKDQRGGPPHLSRWSDGWRHLKAIIMLKPASLYPFVFIFPTLAILFYPHSFSIVFLMLSLTYLLILALGSMELLKYAIEKPVKRSVIANFLLQFKLVPLTILFSFGMGVVVLVLPDSRLGTKLFIINIFTLTYLWLFLNETIKTHLVNRLP